MAATVDGSALLRRVERMTLEGAQALGDALGDELRGNASRRSGELVDSIEVGGAVPSAAGATVSITVGAPQGRYREEGTGIYGPDGQRITPNRPGGVLAFDWPAAGGLVIVASVAGSPPDKWWSRSLDNWPRIVAGVW